MPVSQLHKLAMSASQRALDVVGQNIANINTTGYTRQRLDIASVKFKNGSMYSNGPAKVGYGVKDYRISQLRDLYLDAQYRTQIAKLGTTDAHAAGLEQLSTVFDETVKDGVRDALRNISSSLTQLSEHVGEQEFDSTVRSNMQILLNLFHENSSRLEDIRKDISTSLTDTDVAGVNDILKNIANLNKTIKNSHVLGNPALELQDQRNHLTDQLSSYLPVSVKYREEEVGPGQFVEVVDIHFTASDGSKYTLVSDDEYGRLDASIQNGKASLSLTDFAGNSFSDMEELLATVH